MNEISACITPTRKIILALLTLLFLSCAHNPPQPQIPFEDLTAGLNTPPLIDKYQRKHFRWASESQGGGCAGTDIGISLKYCPPNFIYNNKGKGNCGAFTTFAVHCLRKAGYEAYPVYIFEQWPGWLAPGHQPRDYHIMVLYRDKEQWFTIDNGKLDYQFGIKGPFAKIEDLPYQVLRLDKNY